MIEEILSAANLPAWPGRCPAPPLGTYAVFFDSVTADGPDGFNRIFTHDCMVELYEPQQDPDTETAVETELNARGIPWTKQPRYWLKDIQRYQTIYEFTYIEKT